MYLLRPSPDRRASGYSTSKTSAHCLVFLPWWVACAMLYPLARRYCGGRGSAPTKARSLGRTSHCTFRCANALAGTLSGCLRCDLLRLPRNADTGVSARKSWTLLRRHSAVGHALRAHAGRWLAFLRGTFDSLKGGLSPSSRFAQPQLDTSSLKPNSHLVMSNLLR